MKTIVTLVDFSDVTPKLIEQSGKFAKALGSRVILVHIVPTVPVVVDAGIGSPLISEPPSPEIIRADYERVSSLGTPLRNAGLGSLETQNLRQQGIEVIRG